MKKIILLITLIFLSACSNETMQGYLTVDCIKEDNFNQTKNINTISVKHKDNNVVNIKYSYKYETEDKFSLDSYKKSLISESNKYKNIQITQNEKTDSFEIIYDINIESINDEIKKDFDITDLASNQIKKLESKGYSCK